MSVFTTTAALDAHVLYVFKPLSLSKSKNILITTLILKALQIGMILV